jgi:hypothetical protein
MIDVNEPFWAALFGAFFGSATAFILAILKAYLDREQKRHSALVETLYALYSQWNILEGIRRHPLEARRNEPDRFMKIPIFEAPGRHSEVPFKDITFILQSDDPNLLQDIHLAEQSFEIAFEALKIRNRCLTDFYDSPEVKKRDFDFETGASLVEAPRHRAFWVKETTNALYDSVDNALPKLKNQMDSVYAFTKRKYPKKKTIQFVPIEELQKDRNSEVDFATNYNIGNWLRFILNSLKNFCSGLNKKLTHK